MLSELNTLGLGNGEVENRGIPLSVLSSTHCFSDHEQTHCSPWDRQDRVFLEIPSGQVDPEIHIRIINTKSEIITLL